MSARHIAIVALMLSASPALAQSPSAPLERGGGMIWGSVGMQGDVGGGLNNSGLGNVGNLPAEVNRNTWGERYDAALIFRIGGAYNVTEHSQLFTSVGWQQAEADEAVIGLIGGQSLTGQFSDYQGWGIDGGYRYVFATTLPFNPFVGGGIGFERLHAISLSLSSPVFSRKDIPFYGDSVVASWRIGAGFLWSINSRFGAHVSLDLKHTGVLSDQSGLGAVGFDRVNNIGNRWTLPVMTGVYVKF
jgi:hypothetical protein